MKLPIRVKMFSLVALVLVLALVAVLIKTSESFRSDKELFVREFSDRFTGTVARLASDRVLSFQTQTTNFVAQYQSLITVQNKEDVRKNLFERFPQALAVGVLKKGANGWDLEWAEKADNSTTKSWSEGFERTIIRGVNPDAAMASGLHLSRVLQSNGMTSAAIAFPADLQSSTQPDKTEKAVLVSIINILAFEDLIKEFKGDINEVFIIDRVGFVYAHPDPKQMSGNLEKHPLVQEITKDSKEGATGLYKDLSEADIIGSYRRVKSTNLYVVSTTPTQAAFQAADSLIKGVISFGVGFGLIGVVIAVIVAGRITNPILKLQEIAARIGSGDFNVPVNVEANDEVGELAKSIEAMKVGLVEREEKIEHSKQALIQSEKMSAFGQLSAGIAHEVKNPLAGILGHAQLAKGKAKDNDLVKHLEVIEKETRRTKEIVENLMKFARAEKAELTPTSLFEVVDGACGLVDHQLTLMGVKIIKKINQVPTVNANGNQLQQVLLNLMMNAGHAMEKANTKELTVFLEEVGDLVRIRIQDTGHGMPPEVKKRLFEPFFTTKPPGKGTGLGLSVSFGIVRDHNGKIYVESEAGRGTTFFIDLPKAGKELAVNTPVAAGAVAPAMPSASLPTPPPKASQVEPIQMPSSPAPEIQDAKPHVSVKEVSLPDIKSPAAEETHVTSPTRVLEPEPTKTNETAKNKLASKLVQGDLASSLPPSPFGSLPNQNTNSSSVETAPQPLPQSPLVPKNIESEVVQKEIHEASEFATHSMANIPLPPQSEPQYNTTEIPRLNKTLGGKSPISHLGDAPEASTSPVIEVPTSIRYDMTSSAIKPMPIEPPADLPKSDEMAYATAAPVDNNKNPLGVQSTPPPSSNNQEDPAYVQPKPEGEFKVSIRRPKLKV